MSKPDTFEQGRKWLRNRSLRRKLIAMVLLLLMVAIVSGTWLIDGWLETSLMRFGVFWGVVALYTILLMMLCIYDMLRIKHGE